MFHPDIEKQLLTNNLILRLIKRHIPLLTLYLLFCNPLIFGNDPPELNDRVLIDDGPYIFLENNELKARWIEDGVLRENLITRINFLNLSNRFNLKFEYDDLRDAFQLKPDHEQNYSPVDSIAVISDVHGEYGNYINLLHATGIIDHNLNWNFGKGHLVVLGDVFDRGEMVTEIFWHLFGLEKQAVKAGGKVHFLLGNHEVMVLSNDLMYISDKYRKVESICDTTYSALFSDSTVIGSWLRSKPVIITINNILFVHAGISVEMVHRNMPVAKINRIFSEKIVGKDIEMIQAEEETALLNDDLGPVWYRGYYMHRKFNESQLDTILSYFDKNHIIIGHTPNMRIRSFFNNKILAVDTGIIYKRQGEMLIYKNGDFYRGRISGKRIKL